MKDYIKSAKSGLIFWISALLIFVLWASVYAGWTSISKVKSSDTLKANEWNTMIDNMQYLDWRINWWLVIPSWLVSAFYLDSCPSGWKAADWTDHTIDLRWKFIRWINNFWWKWWLLSWDDSDEDRWDSIWLWTYQEDAIRNLTGSITDNWGENFSYLHAYVWQEKPGINGVFDYTHSTNMDVDAGSNRAKNSSINLFFDASRVVPTWKDNRPKNIWLIYCVKE